MRTIVSYVVGAAFSLVAFSAILCFAITILFLYVKAHQ